MKKILHSLRNKPDHIKSRYVIVFAVLATVLVIGLWLTTLRLINKNDDTIKAESPFKSFKEIFSTTISETKKQYPQSQPISETLGELQKITDTNDPDSSLEIINNTPQARLDPLPSNQE